MGIRRGLLEVANAIHEGMKPEHALGVSGGALIKKMISETEQYLDGLFGSFADKPAEDFIQHLKRMVEGLETPWSEIPIFLRQDSTLREPIIVPAIGGQTNQEVK